MNPVVASDISGSATPLTFVLSPDLVGRSLFDAQHAAVLRLWRDRQIRPALNRSLLLCYMRLLRQLGLDDRLLKRWAWWFNSTTQTAFLEDTQLTAPVTVPALCTDVARRSQALCVIHGASVAPPPCDVPWLTAAAFQEKLGRS
jgi:hypothetical protein